MNRIIDTDSYKASHYLQYPPKTTKIFSYLESRGSERGWKESVFFGLQYILQEYFLEPFTKEDVWEANTVIRQHGEPFNYEGWMHIINNHKGYLPLRIRAVPEGTVVPLHNVLMTVENTCPHCFWVTSWFETQLMRLWYPITVATQSYQLKKLIYKYLKLSSDNPDSEIPFKLHDFGARGVSSRESAMIGGAAHLVNFQGTDTMAALALMQKHYFEPLAGFSIPAGEHSSFSSWGREHETDAYRNMLGVFGGKGKVLAVVSDTWDIYNACEHIWGEELKQEVIDSGATVVIRPDSGDPLTVLLGTQSTVLDIKNSDDLYDYLVDSEEYQGDVFRFGGITYRVSNDITDFIRRYGHESFSQTHNSLSEMISNSLIQKIEWTDTPETKGIVGILAEKFGTTVNSKGYKVLNNVRLIQGDGVNAESILAILQGLTDKGYSATNITFGMGGALLQKVDRDTLKFAYKCSSAIIDGKRVDVYKDPITDTGKRSKRGRLDLIKVKGKFETVVLFDEDIHFPNSEMDIVYENGQMYNPTNLRKIRKLVRLEK